MTAFSPEVQAVLDGFVNGYPSPADWRDCWIYFLLLDRFNNPAAPPHAVWNCKYNFRQGGTFEGVRVQLPYLQNLGVKALWLSPIVKNTRPEIAGFEYAYSGYCAQDFLTLDGRFASDGTEATAGIELQALVQ
ncbi:MAG TPA: alpha-amylase family glycosyl hydrolase, partial [Bryobacteraceae bacterium]